MGYLYLKEHDSTLCCPVVTTLENITSSSYDMSPDTYNTFNMPEDMPCLN